MPTSLSHLLSSIFCDSVDVAYNYILKSITGPSVALSVHNQRRRQPVYMAHSQVNSICHIQL